MAGGERRLKEMTEFRIECGVHTGTVKARTLGAAWRKVTRRRITGFAPIARFKESNSVWFYITPEGLDATP